MKENSLMNKVLKLSIPVILSLALTAPGFTQRRGSRETTTSFKSVLAKVSQKVRTEFLESMFFVNGKLASARIKELKLSLNKHDFEVLQRSVGLGGFIENWRCSAANDCVRAIGYICSAPICGLGAGVEPGYLLRRIPQADQHRYLDSLDFKDGRFAGGDVRIIERYINKTDLDRLPRSEMN